jgi:hypothetical protein
MLLESAENLHDSSCIREPEPYSLVYFILHKLTTLLLLHMLSRLILSVIEEVFGSLAVYSSLAKKREGVLE